MFPDTSYRPIRFSALNPLGPLTNGYTETVQTWKIWHGITANSGITVATHTGLNGTQPPRPALQIKTVGNSRTAINTFPIGDTSIFHDRPPTRDWDVRSDWLRTIYSNHFGLAPAVALSGPGAAYVLPDYRVCRNGSILLSLLNEHTNQATVTVTAHSLLDGRIVENLTQGGILETNSDGVVTLSLTGDEYVVLYAYARQGASDASLINSNPNKIWLQSGPVAVWPRETPYQVAIGYDVRDPGLSLGLALEQTQPRAQTLTRIGPTAVNGTGTLSVPLTVPDPDLNDPIGVSSLDGGQFVLRAWLETGGQLLSETILPVRLLWGVRPTVLPNVVTPGATYQVPVEWQELPSYEPSQVPWLLSRADLWDPVLSEFEHYDVVLELQAGGQTVASEHYLTSRATDRHTFTVRVPANASAPFSWSAYLRPAPNASPDVHDGFEERGPGADPAFLAPWTAFIYPYPSSVQYLDSGVQGESYGAGSRSAFL
ncbi:MAG TPA: hypothetical protein VNM37_04165, partial [Candidatus Dormibacteraeota bacterium]|nr:hypothetical protein [Candidatus Dormibacteraeota bacterium]